MKKRISQLAILLCIVFTSDTIQAGIQFTYGNWEGVIEQSRQTGKPIFLDTYASYCVPCQMMDRDVFTNPEVAQYFNENFINYKINIQTEEGRILQFLYEIKALPDLIFVDPDGNVILRNSGSLNKDGFLSLGMQALDQYSEKGYDVFYVSNHEEQTTVASEELPSPSLEVADMILRENPLFESYLARLPFRIDEERIAIIHRDMQLFQNTIGNESAKPQMRRAIQESVVQAINERSKKKVRRALRLAEKLDLEQTTDLAFQMETLYQVAVGEWSSFAKSINKECKRTFFVNVDLMKESARMLMANSDQKSALRKAHKWMKIVNDYHPTVENQMLKNVLLAKLHPNKSLERIDNNASIAGQ